MDPVSLIGPGAALLTTAVKALEGPVREKLGKRQDQLAFKKAVSSALSALQDRSPELAQCFLDETFVREHAAELVNQFLLGSSSTNIANDFAERWRSQFATSNAEASRGQESAAVTLERFLDDLAVHLSGSKAGQDVLQFRAAQERTGYLRKAAGEPPTLQESNRILADYLAWLESRHLYLDARGTFQTQRQVQLKLDEIFVELSASEETSIDADLYRSVHSTTDASAEDSPVALAELVRRHRILVILGDPGGGKSTLVRYLAYTGAKATREHLLASGSAAGRSVPILLRVASLVDQADWRTRSLVETIVSVLESSECPRAGLLDLVETRLSRGQCHVLLDGLDEVTESDDRRAIVRKIDDFILRYGDAGNRFVVTSRIAGYREAALGGPVRHFVIRDMTRQQQRDFLAKWCRAVEDAETPDATPVYREEVASREVEAIMGAISASRGVAALAANPLLLRTLALIHRTGAQLPDKRVELYRLAADTLAQTWRVAQGVPKSALVGEQVLTRILSRVAMWMHAAKPSGSASHDEVFRVIAEEWCGMKGATWDPDNLRDDFASEIAAFLETVRVQTGLFVERAPNEYGFMHLTFEEYYAARQLIRRRNSAPALRARLHDPRWKEPILLSIGFVGLQYPDDASELVRTAILGEPEEDGDAGYGPSRWEDLLHRDLMFALECIADGIPVDPLVSQRVIQRSLDLVGSESQGWIALRNRCGQLLGKISENPAIADDPRTHVRSRLARHDAQFESLIRSSRYLFISDEAFDLAIDIYEDESRELTERQFALRSLSVLPYARLSERASSAVADAIMRNDPNFVDAALEALDRAILPDDLSGIEATLVAMIEAGGEGKARALQTLVGLQWNSSTPKLIQLLIDAAQGQDDSSRRPGEALYALARSAYAEEHVRVVAEVAADLVAAEPESYDGHFAVTWILGRSFHTTPLEELVDASVLERLTRDHAMYVHGDDEMDRAGAHLLDLALRSSVDGAIALYVAALASEYEPEGWWHAVAARWHELGPLSRVYLAKSLREVELSYELWKLIASGDSPEMRAAAVHAAALVPEPDLPTEADARALLTDPHPDVRATAVALIELSTLSDADQVVRGALFDPDSNVRTAALRVVCGDERFAEDLPSAIANSLTPERDVWERTAAITALMGSVGDWPLDGDLSWLRNVSPPTHTESNSENAEELEFFARSLAVSGASLDPVYETYRHFVAESVDADFPFWADAALTAAVRIDPEPKRAIQLALDLAVEYAHVAPYVFNSAMRILQDLAAEQPALRTIIVESYENAADGLFSSSRARTRQDALEALESLSQLAPLTGGTTPSDVEV